MCPVLPCSPELHTAVCHSWSTTPAIFMAFWNCLFQEHELWHLARGLARGLWNISAPTPVLGEPTISSYQHVSRDYWKDYFCSNSFKNFTKDIHNQSIQFIAVIVALQTQHESMTMHDNRIFSDSISIVSDLQGPKALSFAISESGATHTAANEWAVDIFFCLEPIFE